MPETGEPKLWKEHINRAGWKEPEHTAFGKGCPQSRAEELLTGGGQKGENG